MLIKLVRHAQSMLNARQITHAEIPNHAVPITDVGVLQAKAVGKELGKDFLEEALIYRSPYLRTRQTTDLMLEGAGLKKEAVKIYEDPRLREIDHGYNNPEMQKPLRAVEGWFWYRYDGGESPADCYDRAASFTSSMMRQIKRKQKGPPELIASREPGTFNRDVVIVSHGMLVMTFVMRFLHLSVEQFETMAVPRNCSVVTIGPKHLIQNPQFTSGKWAVEGLTMREEVAQ